ncbi:nickel-dependent hydrogenase large subunit [Desulfurococcaceae archaeon MEX13E-LK6-19]|nr:nickel-dependent hydrogenase large subunit [Desulfurococcaceae archaeon MEX13E-LK6-19]
MAVDKIIEVPLVLEIPVGPQHPALHEPLLLKVYAEGEEIVKVEINTGYNHRGIEKLCEKRSFYKDIFLVGRVCGICNTVHADCFVRAVEEILGVTPSDRARYLRTLAQELERIHSHMLINAVMAEIVGYETLFMLIMRDRELIMKAKEILTGCRVLADYIMVGGVRRDIDDAKKEKILKILDKIEPKIKYYMKVFEEDVTITKRLVDVGIIEPKDVTLHSLVGPIARASNIHIDVRKSDKYDAYGEVPFEIVVRKEKDSWARMMVRWEEALVSLEICKYILENLPNDGKAVPDERRLPRRFPPGETFTRVEAPRGELTYYVKSDGKPNPYRVKIRTPSYNNIINTGFVYLEHSIADLPVILVSFDPCISCMERVVVIDLAEGSRKLVPLKKLASKG